MNLGMAKPISQRRQIPRLAQAFRASLLAALAIGTVGLIGACGSGSDGESANDGKPEVLTTFTVIADMTRQVAGDRVTVNSITKPGAEVHGYEPTPSDLKAAARADVIFENGLNLERWFEQFVDRSGAEKVTLTEGITPISITGDSEYAGKPNPHAWMSTDNALIYVENIRKALTDLDPAGKAEFQANADAYSAKIESIKGDLVTSLENVPADQRALVTCEGAFAYLARDLDLTEQYLWPVNAERQGTPQQIAATVEFVRDREVPGVFCESTVSSKPMEQVAREAGSQLAGVLYVDSLSEPGGTVPTYLDLLRVDADTIAAGLTGDEGMNE
jgi:manganese transport system substrate-binding protein